MEKSLLSNGKQWWKETLTFAKQPPETNLERAGQYLRGHSLFIACFLRVSYTELVIERTIKLELRHC